MDAYKEILKLSYKDLCRKLSVGEEFIIDIYEEKNSWNFISKLAQFIEGIFTKVIVQRLNEPEIFSVISNLPQNTRINFSYALRIVSKNQRDVFLTIAEIRNDYIHNVSNVDVSLGDYFLKLKSNRQTEIVKRLKPFLEDKNITVGDFAKKCQNLLFSICALELAKLNGLADNIEISRRHQEYRLRQASKLLPKAKTGSLYLEDKMAVDDHVENAARILKDNGML